MNYTTTNAAEGLLEQTRQQVRTALGVMYLVFVGAAYVLAPQLLDSYTVWGISLAVLGLMLNSLGLFRNKYVNLSFHVALLLLLLPSLIQTIQQNRLPGEPLLWSTALVLYFFVTLDSHFGLVFAALIAISLVVAFQLYPTHSTETLAVWLVGGAVMLIVGFLGFRVMRFIEGNITLHEEATDKLKAAQLDALTGIYGRAAIEEELRRTVKHAQKSGTALSVIVTDIDHFKQVNDKHGHGVGDDVLRAFAKRLRRNVGGSGGMVGRWGGEEFLIILPGVARPDALAMGERLRQAVSDSLTAGVEITASFGVASYRGAGDDTEQLFGRADERLYEAKADGRNMVR